MIQLAIYKWYILPIGCLFITYHLLGEPETAIDMRRTPLTPYQTQDMNTGLLVIRFCKPSFSLRLAIKPGYSRRTATSGFYEVKLHHDWNGEIMG